MTDVVEDPLFDQVVNTDPVDGYIRRSAVLSRELNEQGIARYRYVLERTWDYERPLALWIMLNPSTADAFVDDATIRRCRDFSKTYGMGSIRVINMFAFRTHNPKRMLAAAAAGVDVVGPQNDELIIGDLAGMNVKGGLTICAWGTGGPVAKLLVEREAWLREHYYGAWCLGQTKDGHPKHPLYLPSVTALSAW